MRNTFPHIERPRALWPRSHTKRPPQFALPSPTSGVTRSKLNLHLATRPHFRSPSSVVLAAAVAVVWCLDCVKRYPIRFRIVHLSAADGGGRVAERFGTNSLIEFHASQVNHITLGARMYFIFSTHKRCMEVLVGFLCVCPLSAISTERTERRVSERTIYIHQPARRWISPAGFG